MAAPLVLILGPTGQSVSNLNNEYKALTAEQQTITKRIQKGFQKKTPERHFVLHAEPGCGKSNVTRWLAAHAFGESTEFAACTASLWLRAKIGQPVADLISSTAVAKVIADPKQIGAIIFEEYSMLEGKLLSAVHERMGNPSVPFAGLPVLFTGDQFQLPTVSGDSCLRTPIFQQLRVTVLELREQCRLDADNDEFLDTVREIKNAVVDRREVYRNSDYINYSISTLGGFRTVPKPHQAQFLCCTKDKAREWNLKALQHIVEEQNAKRYVISPSKKGNFDPQSPANIFLVEGCRVMVRHNVYDKTKVVAHNGELGTFVSLTVPKEVKEEEVYVNGSMYTRIRLHKSLKFYFDPNGGGETKCLTPVQKASEEDLKKKLFVPFQPAHAITVHKAQGITLCGRVHFDTTSLDGMLQANPGLLYVALTRVTSGRSFTANISSFQLNAIIKGLPPLYEEHRAGIRFARTACL